MVHLVTNKNFTCLFRPTEELKKELDESLKMFNFNDDKLIVKEHNGDYTIVINDDLASEMLIELYEKEMPDKWKSILRYIYVMI